jgi:Xaa-Pro aminopeptidase
MSDTISARITALRQAMQSHRIDACIIPSNDPHQSEYVAGHWKAREWISGFTGSAGTVVVTNDRAGLWTDSRYFLQAETELVGSGIDLHRQGNPGAKSHTDWLLDTFGAGARVAIDGKLLSEKRYQTLLTHFNQKAIVLVTDKDPVGEAWTDRPALPADEIYAHDLKYAGRTRGEKLSQVRASMAEYRAENHLLSTLDDIAWLFNLRGSDVDFNPVFYAYALVQNRTTMLFVDPAKVPEELAIALKGDSIDVLPPDRPCRTCSPPSTAAACS